MKQFLFVAVLLVSGCLLSQNERIDQLTVQLAYQEQDSTKVDTSLQLIGELFKVEDYSKALLFINQTNDLAEKLGYKKGLAKSHYFKAQIYAQRKDFLNALSSYQKAGDYFSEINDALGTARVNNRIGLIQIERGNYAEGLKNSLSAITIFEDNDLKEDLSSAYNNLAEAYTYTGNLDSALDFNKKALEVREELNDSDGIKITLSNIGKLYSEQNEYRRALDYYERALAMLNPNVDIDLRGSILSDVGLAHLKLGNLDRAGSFLAQGLRYNRRQKNEQGVLKSLNAIGNLNLQEKRYRTAQSQLNEANNLAKKLKNNEELLENFRLFKVMDSSRGFYQNAFYWQSQYFKLKSEMTKTDAVILPPAESVSIEDTSKSETAILDKPEELSATNEKKSLLTYGLIAGLLISIALLIFTFLRNTKDKKDLKTYVIKTEDLQNEKNSLTERNAQLEEINAVKDKLFSIVSHDLKDSISSIKAFLDLLKDDNITIEEFNQLIPELSENANNASSLLFNLLNWSKSQMQNLQPKPELFNIQEVFQTKMALVEKKVTDKGILLVDESRRDFVYADRSMLEIVIQNLITNAVKFSGKGDVITVSNQDYNNNALICVEDTGIGISKENIQKLFNARNNFTTIGTRNEKGTGLGLTICKDLVELNKGRIWVESTPNIGSKFFIELPKGSPGPPQTVEDILKAKVE
ncbi:tetratricopeptide repeat protein [Winogradskyella maritima]|uniref:histidine kinase n=1 Tax=Winogradskyella maritima TaxID=1517766 RepID=A0ABV8AM12_9FLAO|nr:tetratricopeptide repeat protein [Winogradskyella maritima]